MSLGIFRSNENDYGEIISLYSTAIESVPIYFKPSEKETAVFLHDMENISGSDAVYVMKERGRVIAFLWISYDVSGSLFASSHSYSKTNDLFYDAGFGDENVLFLKAIYVDPKRQNHGLGSELLQSALARYKGSSWILALNPGNPHLEGFFLHRGFSKLGERTTELPDERKTILYRKYRPSGLCREANW